MNILVVTERFTFGGLETQLLGFIRQVQRLGHRASFAVSVGADSRRLHDAVDGRVLSVPLAPILTGEGALSAAEAIADFSRRERCDLLHLHPFRSLAIGAIAAARARLPFVLTLHGPGNLILADGDGPRVWMEDVILPAADRVFCVCAEVARMVAGRVHAARLTVLSNGVDLSRFRPARRDPSGAWAVVSRLDSDKLPSVLFALEALLSDDGPAPAARVFGEGTCRAELESWLAARGFAPRVTLEERTDSLEEELREGFAGVAGMTRVALEAGAMNLPVLLAGYDGARGLVRSSQMDELADANFSGRGRPVLLPGELARQMEALSRHPAEFDLRPWVERNANEALLWGRYLALVERAQAPDPAWSRRLLASIERHREAPVLSREIASDLP